MHFWLFWFSCFSLAFQVLLVLLVFLALLVNKHLALAYLFLALLQNINNKHKNT